MKRLLLAFLISAPALPAAAQDAARLSRAAEVWSSLSAEQKALVRRNWPRYQALSDAEKKRVAERFELFKSLPAADREALRARHAEVRSEKRERGREAVRVKKDRDEKIERGRQERRAERLERRERLIERREERMERREEHHEGGHGPRR